MNTLLVQDSGQTSATTLDTVEELYRPKVSVIIPAYNMAEFLEEAILSALTGELSEVEVLVVDDGSEDETADVVARFTDPKSAAWDPRVRYMHQRNQGKPIAMNAGLSASSGEYVAILDADDKLPPNSLRMRYEHACAGTGDARDLVVGAFDVFDGDSVFGRRSIEAGLSRQELQKKYVWSYRIPFHLNACLFSRRLIDRVGGLDERLIRCQDIDFALRSLDASETVTTIDEVVYSYRKHRQSRRARLRFRMKTLYYRPMALQKNLRGMAKYPVIGGMMLLDLAKLIYEVRGNYLR